MYESVPMILVQSFPSIEPSTFIFMGSGLLALNWDNPPSNSYVLLSPPPAKCVLEDGQWFKDMWHRGITVSAN